MKKLIEKFYSLIFEDKEEEPKEEVPYANKVFMFYFSIIVSLVVLILIIGDIIKNIEKINSGQ
jgi:hypothetical protein